jgi:hypothetical protein
MTQSALVAHVVAQAAPLQTNGSHLRVVATGHTPLPSHLAASVSTPAVHPASRHETSGPANAAHSLPFVPSHDCFAHGSEPLGGDGHSPCFAAPATGVHAPLLVARSHDSHTPVHALSQQTPSAATPLVHSAALAALSPFGFFAMHTPPEQKCVVAQSVAEVQVVAQLIASLHTYGAHIVGVEVQVPEPSQLEPETTPAVHVVAPHAVPEGAFTRHAPIPSHMPSALHG